MCESHIGTGAVVCRCVSFTLGGGVVGRCELYIGTGAVVGRCASLYIGRGLWLIGVRVVHR